MFEDSEKNIVFKYGENQENIDSYFPFMMTQAPTKPILHPVHIKEYYKFNEILNDSDYLILIGYSLGENDYHINAHLRDFLVSNREKKIIYCMYAKPNQNVDEAQEKNRVLESLRLDKEKYIDRIIMIQNDGDPNNLKEKIKEYLK